MQARTIGRCLHDESQVGGIVNDVVGQDRPHTLGPGAFEQDSDAFRPDLEINRFGSTGSDGLRQSIVWWAAEDIELVRWEVCTDGRVGQQCGRVQ